MRYPIIIHKDKDSDYGVTVPDIPGCFSAGNSIDDAIKEAQEAIECHLEGALMDGETVPPATDIETHQADFDDGIWALVDVDLSKLESKSKRINITMAERVLSMVDESAEREHETRSGFLAKAAISYIQRNNG